MRARADEFALEHLPLAGGLRTSSSSRHTRDDYWILPFDMEVTVPAEGILAVIHDAAFGGRVDVAGIGPDGNAVSGRWSLRDGNGIEVLSGHVVGATPTEENSRRRLDAGPERTFRPAAAGP